MDWITGISKAIDYIEEHITEPTDYARAAKDYLPPQRVHKTR